MLLHLHVRALRVRHAGVGDGHAGQQRPQLQPPQLGGAAAVPGVGAAAGTARHLQLAGGEQAVAGPAGGVQGEAGGARQAGGRHLALLPTRGHHPLHHHHQGQGGRQHCHTPPSL